MTNSAEIVWRKAEEHVTRARKHLRLAPPQKSRRVLDREIGGNFDAITEQLRIRFLFPDVELNGFERLYEIRYEGWRLTQLRQQANRTADADAANLIEQIQTDLDKAIADLESELLPTITPVQQEIIIEKFLTSHSNANN
jgi:hypothetical protein